MANGFSPRMMWSDVAAVELQRKATIEGSSEQQQSLDDGERRFGGRQYGWS